MSRSAPRHAAPRHAQTGPGDASTGSIGHRGVDLGRVGQHAATHGRARGRLSRTGGIAAVTAAVVAISGSGYVLSLVSSADVVASGVGSVDIAVVTMSPTASPVPTASPSSAGAPTPTAADPSTAVPTRRGTASPTPGPTSMRGVGAVALSPDTLAARKRVAAAAAAVAKKAKDTKDAKDRAAAAARSSRSSDRQVLPSGSPKAIARAMLATYGWGDDQFTCLVTMWDHESGWNLNAENPGSGAFGIPQALPGAKMAKYGSDWRTNAATQISWGLDYIKTRYNTPCGAWSFWQRGSWY